MLQDRIINDRFPCKRLKGITLIIGINVEKTADSVAFDQRQLINDVANYTGQTDAPNEFSPFPAGWEGFTSDDCVIDAIRGALVVGVLQRHFKNYGPLMIKMLLRLVRYLKTTRTRQRPI